MGKLSLQKLLRNTSPRRSIELTQRACVKKLYVGNFSFSMTDPELRSLFEAYGRVESATIVRNPDTGRSRGSASVAMTENAEAEKAMAELNGKDAGGRFLTVNEARAPK